MPSFPNYPMYSYSMHSQPLVIAAKASSGKGFDLTILIVVLVVLLVVVVVLVALQLYLRRRGVICRTKDQNTVSRTVTGFNQQTASKVDRWVKHSLMAIVTFVSRTGFKTHDWSLKNWDQSPLLLYGTGPKHI